MTYRNYIDIDVTLLDKPVYRIMPIHRLLELLSNSNLVLVKPEKWDDPFENALLSAPVKSSRGEVGRFSAKDSVYGQCWTLHRETDAMWRIYSPDKQGVKIRTTPRKLLSALSKSEPKFPELRCFIGRVQYLTQKELLSQLSNINLFDTNGSGIAESLLYKRREFSHEKEIRVIYASHDSVVTENLYKFAIEPNELLEEIVFDPRMDHELVTAYKFAIKNKGYLNRLAKSQLYAKPKGLVIKI